MGLLPFLTNVIILVSLEEIVERNDVGMTQLLYECDLAHDQRIVIPLRDLFHDLGFHKTKKSWYL